MYTEKKIKQDRIVSRSYLSLMRQFSEDVKKKLIILSVYKFLKIKLAGFLIYQKQGTILIS